MPLPSTTSEVVEFLSLHGFQVHDADVLEFGVDPESSETEWVFLDDLTTEQWDGVEAVVWEYCGGWPHSAFSPPAQLSFI